MKRTFASSELERVWSWKNPGSAFEATGVSTDTRTLKPGDLFFCLSGENFDAHDFVETAAEKNAAAVVVRSDRAALLPRISCAVIAVEDPLLAMNALAREVRSSLRVPVLAVCGSNGKTSTKDMAYGMASKMVRAYATEGNLNNHIGLPLTLLRVPPDAQIVILELGMNHPGELGALARIARPHHAIVTSIADEHAEFFPTLLDTARAEMEITEGMEPGGIVFFHADAPCRNAAEEACEERRLTLKLFRANDVRADLAGIHLKLHDREVINPAYLSPVMAENLAGAFELLAAAGLDPRRLAEAAGEVEPRAGRRFQVFRKKSGAREILLVDDSYNANEASFVAAIEAMRQVLPSGKIALFAGEMAELGERSAAAHQAVGQAAAKNRMQAVYVSGTQDARILLDAYLEGFKDGLAVWKPGPVELLSGFSADEYDGILVKGSRRAGMDQVSDQLKAAGFSAGK
jgi:UDP-N-acetylmuramoyl-tripeptide--D-alanyl-D-alanine ligase